MTMDELNALRTERQALLQHLALAAVPGSEWTNEDERLYLVITGEIGGPEGALCVRRFDSQGFSGHAERGDAAAAAKEILDWLGTGARPAPGALERLAQGFDELPLRVLLTRPARSAAPWSWHARRVYGLPHDAHQAYGRALDSGLEARVEVLPSDRSWSDTAQAVDALVARVNGGTDAA